MKHRWLKYLLVCGLTGWGAHIAAAAGGPLLAGVAKADITDNAAKADTPLYARAVVLKQGETTAVIITVDAVAIGEIGPIGNQFLSGIRQELGREPGIRPKDILVNPSHCHGRVCKDVTGRTVAAVREAWGKIEEVKAAVGVGFEDRIMQNRRLKLKNGREADVRRAYPLPPSTEIAGVGPIDPEIGILRLDRKDGRPLAVLYNFACHPIKGSPAGENTGDITGFASKVIEDNLDGGAVALFLQGCGGDINPIDYKNPHVPKDAEPLGNMLGLSALKAIKAARASGNEPLRIANETIELPRADFGARIEAMESEQERLLQSLGGTSLDFETFIPLFIKYKASGEFPSTHAHGYLHDGALGRGHWTQLDEENRADIERYVKNIHAMEELIRLNTNLAQLKKHQASNASAEKRTIEAEVIGLRVGDFFLITFPAELSVEVGLGIKARSPHEMTFVSGYSNGYLYYAPTERQMTNPGWAQEDCDRILGPGWQKIFEDKATDLLGRL